MFWSPGLIDLSNAPQSQQSRTPITHKVASVLRAHISTTLQAWLFFSQLSADCIQLGPDTSQRASLWKRYAVEYLADAAWLEDHLSSAHASVEGIKPPSSAKAVLEHYTESTDTRALKHAEATCCSLRNVVLEVRREGEAALGDVLEARMLQKELSRLKELKSLTNRLGSQGCSGSFEASQGSRSDGMVGDTLDDASEELKRVTLGR